MKKIIMILLTLSLVLNCFAGGGKDDDASEKVKIGFLVKQPEEPWFQSEWRFAQQAAAEMGFELVEIGATDGEKVLTGIDNLAAQGAKGFIICTPDTKLGPAIVQRAESHGLKVMSVDDRFVDASDNPLEAVPHMGISAYNIGMLVGESIWDEMQKRGWTPENTMAMNISFDELATAKERTTGAIDALIEAGFPKENIVAAAQKTTDTSGGFDAANTAFTKNPNAKNWVMFALNDEGVLGAVRASEGRGFTADDIIGVGIGGDLTAVEEFSKSNPTGFFATVCISPKRHGYETAMNMYNWIANDKAPEQLILTTGTLMNRDNMVEVRKELEL